MIIRTFQKSYLSQYGLIVILQLILWLGVFILPKLPANPGNEYLEPGYALLHSLVSHSPYLSMAITFVISLITAFGYNYVLEHHDLIPKNSLIGALVFVILFSSRSSFLALNQVTIPAFLGIFVLHNVYSTYTDPEPYNKIFNSSFIIAICSFFYFPSIYFLFFLWMTFFTFRIYKWREWIIVLAGFISPYLLLWTYYFWIDIIAIAFQTYFEFFQSISLKAINISFGRIDYVLIPLTVILFLLSFFRVSLSIQENVINVRKTYWATNLFILITIPGLILSGINTERYLLFIVIGMALIISSYFALIKRFFWSELYLGLIILLIIVKNLLTAFSIL